MKYICQRCGKEFEANHKTAVCKDCHSAKCAVCGKEFQLKWPWTQMTCSRECRSEYVKLTGISKQRTEKAKATLEARYGVSNSQQLQKFSKVCKYCGKPFETRNARQVYCEGPHYGKCPVCGKQTQINDLSSGVKTCSEECRQALIKRTNLEKYGCEVSVNSEHAREVAKQHNLRKYGVDHYSKTDEYKKKFRETMQSKYGTAVPLHNEEIKAKFISTNNVRYGGNSPTCNSEIMSKVRNTNLERYGVEYSIQNSEVKARAKATNLCKYGVEYPMQSAKIRAKAQKENMRRYGSTNFKTSLAGYTASNSDPSKASQYFEFVADPRKYITSHYSSKVNVAQLCLDLEVTDTPIYNHIIKNDCQDLVVYKESVIEHEIIQYLKVLDSSIIIKHKDRSVISPKEIDIYLPEYNLGIECNPTITHNSSLCDPWGGAPKPYRYHQNKSLVAKEHGMFLFHVFGYEWTHNKSVILSMISNLIHHTNKKVYARNCYVVELSNKECIEFLDRNHRQGKLFAKIRLGLRDKQTDELVSVMTFGRMRSTIGTGDADSDQVYELSRFCSSLNASVVGGASKLFKYFIKHYPCEKIVSFSDVSHTKGTLYEVLGFSYISMSEPSYVWVNSFDDKPLNRVNCQKRNLPKLFNEDLDLSKTEKDIMEEHGYVRVFDSGVIRWEWINNAYNL